MSASQTTPTASAAQKKVVNNHKIVKTPSPTWYRRKHRSSLPKKLPLYGLTPKPATVMKKEYSGTKHKYLEAHIKSKSLDPGKFQAGKG